MIPRSIEFVTIVVALMSVAGYFLLRRSSIKTVVAVTLLVLPFVILSVESMDSFLTCDETYLIYEPLNLATDTLRFWNAGFLKTTDILVGIPCAVIKSVMGLPLDILAVIGKSLHWLWGFFFVLLIADALKKLLDSKLHDVPFYTLCIGALLSFPAINIALKIINYDALSMLPGSLSVLWLAYGLKTRRHVYCFAAIVVATLAAQEKVIAGPLLWVAVIVTPLAPFLCATPLAWRKSFAGIAKTSALALLLSLFTTLPFFFVIDLLRSKGLSAPGISAVFMPFLSGAWPFLQWGGIDIAPTLKTCGPVFYPLLFLSLFSSLFLLFSTVSFTLLIIVCKLRKYVMLRGLVLLNDALFLLAGSIGIIATFSVKAHLFPALLAHHGEYLPTATFDKGAILFGAHHLWEHLILSVCWAYALFVNAIPTFFFLSSAVAAVVRLILRRIPGSVHSSIVVELSFTGALAAPFLYAILQIPLGIRYLNLFLVLILVRCCFDIVAALSCLTFRKSVVAVAACSAMVIMEVLPFRPLYGGFRPIWSNYPERYNIHPSRGILNPSWMGWGEEVALAGKRLQKILAREGNPSLRDVRLYHNYYGEWLYRKNEAMLMYMDSLLTDYRYSENDFYILNRMGVTSSPQPFPDKIPPFFTISFRGFVEAWVFRGSDLAANGFRFTIVKP
jgi:hypothetical protein